jgi:uridine phosphorylase
MSKSIAIQDQELQYHIKLKKGDCAPYVITPGDPGRVPQIAAFLDDAKELVFNREYRTFRGRYKGVDVSVTSTGIGGPSAAIAFEELIRVGAKVLIRVGTSGSLQRDIHLGDLVVAQGAIRDEGTSRQYVPIEWPAVADFSVTTALAQAAQQHIKDKQSKSPELQQNSYVGVVHCKDAFYAEEPELLPTAKLWEAKWEAWRRIGCLCTEMEAATLFTVAQMHRVKAGAILSVIGETHDGEVKIGKVSSEDAIISALEAIYLLDQK